MKSEAIYLDTSSFYYYAYTLYKHILHDDNMIPDMASPLTVGLRSQREK